MTTSVEKVTAIIPAHNEARSITRVIETLPPEITSVVVIDDGSRDSTGELARKAGAIVFRNEPARGYDGALNIGFAKANAMGTNIFVTVDGDGEHLPEDVSSVLEPVLRGGADIAAGRRSSLTHTAEKVLAAWTRRLGVHDPLCGLKAYTRPVYEKVGVFDTKQSIGSELMLRGIRAGFRFKSVPIRGGVRMEGDSSRFYRNAFRANWKVFRAFMRVIPLTL